MSENKFIRSKSKSFLFCVIIIDDSIRWEKKEALRSALLD